MLFIIRGLPGSGKTTLANDLANLLNAKHYEADMYFTDRDGKYNFEPKLIKQAHEWCYLNTTVALLEKHITIVANTFSQYWEYANYIDFCELYNFKYHIITCNGKYKSIHNVPEQVIENMRDRWED